MLHLCHIYLFRVDRLQLFVPCFFSPSIQIFQAIIFFFSPLIVNLAFFLTKIGYYPRNVRSVAFMLLYDDWLHLKKCFQWQKQTTPKGWPPHVLPFMCACLWVKSFVCEKTDMVKQAACVKTLSLLFINFKNSRTVAVSYFVLPHVKMQCLICLL